MIQKRYSVIIIYENEPDLELLYHIQSNDFVKFITLLQARVHLHRIFSFFFSLSHFVDPPLILPSLQIGLLEKTRFENIQIRDTDDPHVNSSDNSPVQQRSPHLPPPQSPRLLPQHSPRTQRLQLSTPPPPQQQQQPQQQSQQQQQQLLPTQRLQTPPIQQMQASPPKQNLSTFKSRRSSLDDELQANLQNTMELLAQESPQKPQNENQIKITDMDKDSLDTKSNSFRNLDSQNFLLASTPAANSIHC